MRKMKVIIDGVEHSFIQFHIDQSVWSIVRGAPTPQGVLHPSGDAPAVGWVVVYVDDFLVVGSDGTIDATTETLTDRWKISEKPTIQYGSSCSVE